HGIEGACEVARARSGRWFDPALVAALERTRGDVAFWSALEGEDVESRVASLEPPDRLLTADEERLDRVAEGFALVIDAKSPYTFRHSERVSELAVGAGRVLGLDALAVRDLRRAGLLHDIGKLAVSNRILDKKGPLTAEEWSAVVRHPEYTAQILARIPRFEELAADAAAHHEKLDGSGYHRGLRAEELSAASRLLAVADIFEALTAERPYRAPLAEDEALGLMALDVGTKLCRDAFDALGAHVRSGVALSSAAA
ncbi:MAG TPA: HD-GYP domain-containing protein, partial [Gaiellaceae bacterium]|nr:HD-GYP domain-containing protein [Gaiellaceae bacterium]